MICLLGFQAQKMSFKKYWGNRLQPRPKLLNESSFLSLCLSLSHTHTHTHTHTQILFASYSMLFLFYVTKVSLGPTSLQDQWNNNIQAAVTRILGLSPTCSQSILRGVLRGAPEQIQCETVQPLPRWCPQGPHHLCALPGSQGTQWCVGELQRSPCIPWCSAQLTHIKPGYCAHCLIILLTFVAEDVPAMQRTQPHIQWPVQVVAPGVSQDTLPSSDWGQSIQSNPQEAAQAFTQTGIWGPRLPVQTCPNMSDLLTLKWGTPIPPTGETFRECSSDIHRLHLPAWGWWSGPKPWGKGLLYSRRKVHWHQIIFQQRFPLLNICHIAFHIPVFKRTESVSRSLMATLLPSHGL